MDRVSEMTTDPWRLERFVAAQDRGGTYQRAVAELCAGEKVSHWMWFVFPQIAGLGRSAMAREYAISSMAEARAYLAHPVLGPRLRECARIVAETERSSAERIFGSTDAMKLRSSMTLFAVAAEPDEPGPGESPAAGGGQRTAGEADRKVFRAVLEKYFGGEVDGPTVTRLLHCVTWCARRNLSVWPSRGRCSLSRPALRRPRRPPRRAGPLPASLPAGLRSVSSSR